MYARSKHRQEACKNIRDGGGDSFVPEMLKGAFLLLVGLDLFVSRVRVNLLKEREESSSLEVDVANKHCSTAANGTQ